MDKVADSLQLTALLDRKPKALSGGQRQRVAIGRAIVREPQVFLFDEPLSNLDAALRSQMRIELTDLHAKLGATMIYVTHDQVEAMTMADKIVVLNAGRIEQVGSPMELYDKPTTAFVAGFIGSPKMNLFASSQIGESGYETYGIRPEHLELSTRFRPPGKVWFATSSASAPKASCIWKQKALVCWSRVLRETFAVNAGDALFANPNVAKEHRVLIVPV